MEVIRPRNPSRRLSLLPPDSACIPVTALASIPLSVLPRPGNQILSEFADDEGIGSRGTIAAVALVGSEDGTLALWSATGASRPWHILLAHSDAVVSVRTAMDAPRDARSSMQATQTKCSPYHTSRYDHGGSKSLARARHDSHEPPFFVVTAGANREVKVWGIHTQPAADNDLTPLALEGYTVVGTGRPDDRLSTVELLSERLMVCGFASGTVEVWPVPFDRRGAATLATARVAKQVFPTIHGATITSMTVSLGLADLVTDGGDGRMGRAIFTTSVDHTVVRWVSLAPEGNLTPLCRYCLSSEPAAVVLLPPSNPTTTPCDRGRTSGGVLAQGLPSEAETAAMFRVVAALDGTIIVLEQVTARQLLSENNGRADGRNSRYAISNAFPGTPMVPQMVLQSPSDGKWRDTGGPGFRWGVGGVGRREVGSYDILGGTRGLSKEWAAAGNRRIIASTYARTAWEVDTTEREDAANQCIRECNAATGSRQQKEVSENAAKPSTTRKRNKSQRGDERCEGAANTWTRPSGQLKAAVTTLSIHADGRIDDGAGSGGGGTWQERYRQVSGGKTVKLDPDLATSWSRAMRACRSVCAHGDKRRFDTVCGKPIDGDVVLGSSTFGSNLVRNVDSRQF